MILAHIDLQTTATPVFIYQVPNTYVATIILSIVNRNNTDALIRVALPPSGTFDNSYWIAYDEKLLANDKALFPGISLQAGDSIYIQSSLANLSVVVYGLEDSVTS